MNSALLVVIFPRAEDALNAQTILRMLGAREIVDREHAVSISRRSTDQPLLNWQGRLPLNPAESYKWLPCLFANVLFCEDWQDTRQRVHRAGLDEHFLNELREALRPDTSALLIYAPGTWRAELERLATLLALLKGKLHHTTFPPQVEETLVSSEWHSEHDAPEQRQNNPIHFVEASNGKSD